MRIENKLFAGAAAVVVGVGLATNLGTNTNTGCETYQGYRDNSADGERIFIFDEQTLEKRGGRGPNYALSGDPGMYRNLEIGDEYRLEIKEPVLPVFSKRLLSFENCE